MLEVLNWEQFRDKIVSTDLDGILCKDLEPQTPLYLPPYPVEDIITGRNERHRKVTEKWLEKFGVVYKNLYMLDNESCDWQAIAKFKLKVFSNSKATVFIESDVRQAEYINKRKEVCHVGVF